MSDQEQRETLMRGMTVGACAMAVSVALPSISVTYQQQLAEADYRLQVKTFAEFQDAGDAVRADPKSTRLMEHPWLARVEHELGQDNQAPLSDFSNRGRDGIAIASFTSFQPKHMDVAEQVERDFQCLSDAVYYEAGNEPREGQLAVAEVIANRVKDHRYPNSICEVVYQGSHRVTGCQFTFTCDGALDRQPHARKYERAQQVAAHVMMDLHERRTDGATHYHATYVNPVWNSGLIRTAKIKTHIFYRFPRGAEWARAERALNQRRSGLITKASARAPAEKSVETLTPAP